MSDGPFLDKLLVSSVTNVHRVDVQERTLFFSLSYKPVWLDRIKERKNVFISVFSFRNEGLLILFQS